ncbi:MAG: DUF6172 family protein, partial [Hydrogenophaga sp.]
MKKTFALRPEGKHPDRVLDALKNELRKYMKRERRRDLPAGADFWDFDCKLGADEASAQTLHPNALIEQLDALAKTGVAQAYVELLVKPASRQRWADSGEGAAMESDPSDEAEDR